MRWQVVARGMESTLAYLRGDPHGPHQSQHTNKRTRNQCGFVQFQPALCAAVILDQQRSVDWQQRCAHSAVFYSASTQCRRGLALGRHRRSHESANIHTPQRSAAQCSGSRSIVGKPKSLLTDKPRERQAIVPIVPLVPIVPMV